MLFIIFKGTKEFDEYNKISLQIFSRDLLCIIFNYSIHAISSKTNFGHIEIHPNVSSLFHINLRILLVR